MILQIYNLREKALYRNSLLSLFVDRRMQCHWPKNQETIRLIKVIQQSWLASVEWESKILSECLQTIIIQKAVWMFSLFCCLQCRCFEWERNIHQRPWYELVSFLFCFVSLLERWDTLCPRKQMCPPLQWVKAHAPVQASTPKRYCEWALTYCTGGHITFLGQSISRLPNKFTMK